MKAQPNAVEQDADVLLDEIEKWMNWLDREFQRALDKIHQTRPISCRTCTHALPGCCHQKTLINLHEALVLARHVKKHGLDTPEFRAQLKAEGIAMEGTSRADWFHEAHPCVFLKDGHCDVYPIRPVICRSYWVVSPAENCQPGVDEGIRHVDHTQVLQELVVKSREIHHSIGLKETNKRILMGALPRMLWIALEAWDSDDYRKTVHSQLWPTDDNLHANWVDGKNPFHDEAQLYRIRSRPPARKED